MGADSKVGRRINKIRNKKARSQRKSRLKHQGAAAAVATASDKQPEAALSNDKMAKMMVTGGGGTGDAVDSESEVDEEESDWEDSGSDEAGR